MSFGPVSPSLAASFPPPVMEARAWLTSIPRPDGLPLINVSQAAPVDPPPKVLREVMAQHILEVPEAHLYGPVLGLPALREEIAEQWSAAYLGRIEADEVAITSGCNQAFCAAVASLARAGDAVILPTPWYFNHKMWLDMMGIEARLLPCRDGMLPDPDEAAALVDDRVKAILLVTPNNPTGAEYPAGLMRGFAELCRNRHIALIVDETYRDFHAVEGPPHDLFGADWQDVLIHLYSFSKVFRLTGHRVGAMIANRERLAQVEKFLDTVTICPAQIGQHAALHGLREMANWVADERDEILARRSAITRGLQRLEGWKTLGTGAYFAYVEHPFDMASDELAKALLGKQAILALPGTMFAPTRVDGGDGSAEQQLRMAFANIDADGIAELIARMKSFQP